MNGYESCVDACDNSSNHDSEKDYEDQYERLDNNNDFLRREKLLTDDWFRKIPLSSQKLQKELEPGLLDEQIYLSLMILRMSNTSL